MNTFNLIHPEHSDIRFEPMIFPDGQPHIKIDMESIRHLPRTEPLRICTRLTSANELLTLLFIKNTLDYLEFNNIHLHISYLLAARMDRVMQAGEPFSLKVIAQILNNAGFRKIKIFDPHSEVSTALIDRSYTISNHAFVKDALDHYFQQQAKEPFCLVSPDAGALKKIHQLAQYLNITNVVECMKERDVRTGALKDFDTATDDLAGQTCCIIDDICDGGGTFAGVAKMLKEKKAGKIVLIVSHGIFSKGTHIPHVDTIYCTNSYRDVDGLHCFDIEKYLQ